MIDPVIFRRHLIRRGFEICGDHSMEFYLLYEKIVDIMAMFDFGQIGLMFLCMGYLCCSISAFEESE